MDGYDPRIRPIQNQTQPIYVNIKFVANNIIEFDTTLQRFSMMGYIRIHWIDHQLYWKPRLYGFTSSMRLPTQHIWTPNIILRKVCVMSLNI